LKFTIDFGFGMLNAMHMGDVFNDMIYQIRPFEVNKGETDRVFRETVDGLCDDLRNRNRLRSRSVRGMAKPKFKNNKILRNTFNVFGKMHEHLWARTISTPWLPLAEKWTALRSIAPGQAVVKITGEFWRRLRGRRQLPHVRIPRARSAQVQVEPIATWCVPFDQAKPMPKPSGGEPSPPQSAVWELKKHLANDFGLRKKLMGIGAGEKMWNYLYHRPSRISAHQLIT